MMQLTKPAKRLSQARYLAFVPLALALVFSFATKGKALTSEDAINLQNTDQLSETPANASLQLVQTSSKDTTRVTNQSIVSINDIRDIAKESKMPLIIVDGLEFSGGIDSIGRIPPEIIQSVLILKDSAAKAFYVPRAARAANDVIIISVRLLTDGEECTVHHSMRVTGNDTTYYVFNEGDVGKLVKSKNLSNYEVSVRKGKDEKIFSEKDGGEVQIYKIKRTKDKSTGSGDQIFEKVEEPPYFQGGEEARIKYLMDNLTYPAAARDSNVQGTVYVSFVVEKDGSISNVEILRGIDDDCDKETIRVIKNMPKWIPGKQRGQAVRVRFAMPVKFVLGE